MKLERLKPEDAAECTRWMLANLVLNDASPRTLKGSIFYKIAGVLYLPIKPVIMLESLAPNPEVTGKRRLLAIRRAMDDLRTMYPGTEFIFLTKGNTKLDAAARFYGFKEEQYRVYRLIGGSKAGKEAGTRPEQLAAPDLRHQLRTGGTKEAGSTGNVSDLRSAAGERRPDRDRPHQGNDNRPGHSTQPLQSGHWSRA